LKSQQLVISIVFVKG